MIALAAGEEKSEVNGARDSTVLLRRQVNGKRTLLAA